MVKRRKTDLLVVHVTATPANFGLTSAKLRAMHKRRGFSNIGYNEWIDRAGTLHVGRGVDVQGAHVRGYNSVSYGIALEGGRDGFDMTGAQMATLEGRLRQLQDKYPDAKICGHRDLSPDLDGDGMIEPHEHTKLCPQFDAIPWAISKGLPAANIKGVWGKYTPVGPDARIEWLQKLLRNRGYAVGPIDGLVGPKTKSALGLFQNDNGLEETREFDVDTVKLLREPIPAPVEPGTIPAQDVKPVALAGLDKPLPQSKTVWAAITGSMSTLISTFGGLDWKVQLVLVAVALGAGMVIFLERKKYRDAARKAGI